MNDSAPNSRTETTCFSARGCEGATINASSSLIAGTEAIAWSVGLNETTPISTPRPNTSEAIRLAMARLGDTDSKDVVLARLDSRDIDTRRKAIEDFVYLRDLASARRLLPLLDDRRDALKAGPTPSTYYLRICDLATDGLGAVLGSTAFPFPTGEYRRYSDEELATMLAEDEADGERFRQGR